MPCATTWTGPPPLPPELCEDGQPHGIKGLESTYQITMAFQVLSRQGTALALANQRLYLALISST